MCGDFANTERLSLYISFAATNLVAEEKMFNMVMEKRSVTL